MYVLLTSAGATGSNGPTFKERSSADEVKQHGTFSTNYKSNSSRLRNDLGLASKFISRTDPTSEGVECFIIPGLLTHAARDILHEALASVSFGFVTTQSGC